MLYVRALFFLVVFPGTAAGWVPFLLARSSLPRFEPGLLFWPGTIAFAAGIAALLWCVWDFARVGRGTLAPIDPPKRVIQRGLYRHVRNPMYLGVLSAVLGEALALGSWAILAWALLLGILFHAFVVLYEEPELRRTFGESYREYCREVPRWLPRR